MNKKITICDVKNNTVTDQIDYDVPETDYDILCDIVIANEECHKDCQKCVIQKLYSIAQN